MRPGVGRPHLPLRMGFESLAYSLAPEARIIRNEEAWFIVNPALGTWAKLSRYAGIMCERSLGDSIWWIEQCVEPAYGKDVLDDLLNLMSDLKTRGLLVFERSCSQAEMVERRARRRRSRKLRPGCSRVYLAVTDMCNLNCATCYRGAAEDDAPTDTLVSTMRNLARLSPDELVITGGEPTLRFDLIELLEMATYLVPEVTLATNATLITQEIAEAVASLGVGVQVSIDSADEAAHDMVRGKGSYRAARDGLDVLAQAGVDEIEVVSTVVDPAAFDPEGMVLFAAVHGASFHASLFQEVGRGSCLKGQGKSGNPADLAKSMLSYLIRACGRGEVPEKTSFDEVIGLVPRAGCGAGTRVLAISGGGSAYPCHLLMLPEFRADLADVIGSNQLCEVEWSSVAELSECIDQAEPVWAIPDVDQIEGCSECDFRYFCGGGCRAAAYVATGSLLGRDPMCEAYRTFISSILRTWDDSRRTLSNLTDALAEVSNT